MYVCTSEACTCYTVLCYPLAYPYPPFLSQARDGGGLAVSAPITITVADINDNAPVFQGQFESTIPENFPLVDAV